MRVVQPAGFAVAPGTAAFSEVARDGLGRFVEGCMAQFLVLAQPFGQSFLEV
ncbi:hypothetical protein ABR738_14605 [Streptomyces sp. Edi4]|uniref:hypothetical protein n=1 Tax=Streptomyces sp. Edi4 TaxID=3162527 RepID=UPI003306053A